MRVATATSRITNMASVNSVDNVLADSLVLVSAVANQKCELSSKKKRKISEKFHNFRYHFVKEGHKLGTETIFVYVICWSCSMHHCVRHLSLIHI